MHKMDRTIEALNVVPSLVGCIGIRVFPTLFATYFTAFKSGAFVALELPTCNLKPEVSK